MPQVINTNIASLNAQRNLNQSQSALATALQRLSSGLRINSAKDDAAGMAIADRMSSQIRGLDQAQRNANDGISLAQTAEGAMVNVSDNLQRIRELAVQSANASNTAADRVSINAEVQQLLQEIDRVATTTQFNGQNLLDGTFAKQNFQVGANASQTIGITVNSMRIANVGTGETSAVSALGATGRKLSTLAATGVASTGPALMNGDLVINGVAIGASNAASDVSSSVNKSASAIAKVAAINALTAQTGVTATVQANTMAGSSMTASAGQTGALVINGFTTSAISTTADLSVTRQSVVAAINAISLQTGVVATDTGQDTAGVRLDAADGRNISIVTATAGDTLTAAATGLNSNFQDGATTITDNLVQYGGYTLSSNKDISVAQGVGGTLSNSGLSAATYKPQMAYASSTSTLTLDATTVPSGPPAFYLSAGDVKINGTLVGASLSSSDTASYSYGSASAIAKAAAVNAVSSATGVTATANVNQLTGASMTAAALTGVFSVNGVQTASITTTTDAAASRALVVSAINAISGQTGVKAVDTNSDTDGVRLEAADGRNIVIGSDTLTAAASGVTMTAVTIQYVTYGNISLTSAKAFTVDSGTSGNGTYAFGIAIGSYGGAKNGQALSSLDISTVEGANAALTAVDNALTQVNSARAMLGAFQNRFASTVSTLQATSENLSAARSRIRDADFAQETANMTRAQILQQAGVAMLAQANALPNTVLSLLK